jgi:hypothetical protein
VTHLQPVVEVVAHVVAAEGQHGERVATDHTLRAEGGSGGFGAERGGHVDAVVPVEGLVHQRHGGGATAAEDEGRDRHAGGIFPVRSIDGHWLAGAVKREFGWAALRPVSLAICRRPVLALPVDQVRRRFLGHAFPPHIAVVGQRDVGEDDVFFQRGHGVEVGLFSRCRGDAEEARFRVDGVERVVPSLPGLIQAMSSPTVVIFQPPRTCGGISMAKLVLPQADGKAAAT